MIVHRNTVLIVGSTGSLGRPIVLELLRRGVKVRLLCRSSESAVQAGYRNEQGVSRAQEFSKYKDIDVVVCTDVTNPSAYDDKWFKDVSCVLCVARPRSLVKGDNLNYTQTISNLCNIAKANNVPRVLLHGIPYVESNIIGDSPTMSVLRQAESCANAILEGSSTYLTISRICEHSEIAHLLEAVDMIGCFPCAYGFDPIMHPISAHDFATSVADYAEDPSLRMKEFLVGGPDKLTWRELGMKVSEKRHIRLVTLPLLIYKLLLMIVGLLSDAIPALKGLCLSMRLMMIPMTTNTANDEFISVGSDTIEAFLNATTFDDKNGWVHQKIYGSSLRPTCIKSSDIIWIVALCDGLTALSNPDFHSKMLSLDLRDVDGILVQSFGCVSLGIVATTFSSLYLWRDAETSKMYSVLVGLLFDIVSFIPMIGATRLNKFHTVLFVALVSLLLISKMKSKHKTLIAVLAVTAFGSASYFVPSIILSALFSTSFSNRSTQHFRQIAISYIGGGVQKLALLLGLKSSKAAGLVSLVWCICSIKLWRMVDMASIFEMPNFSKIVNATFPIWSGLLAALILCRND